MLGADRALPAFRLIQFLDLTRWTFFRISTFKCLKFKNRIEKTKRGFLDLIKQVKGNKVPKSSKTLRFEQNSESNS